MKTVNEQQHYMNDINNITKNVLTDSYLKYERKMFMLKIFIASFIGSLIGLIIFKNI